MRNFKKLVGIALVVALVVSMVSCSARAAVPDSASVGGAMQQTGSVTMEEGDDTVTTSTVGSAAVQSQEMEAYLFVHFIGEGQYNQEQMYFTVSLDGKDWHTLHNGKPVLWSAVGEEGIRDPHIVRSPDGNKFYIIATDLSIYHRGIETDNAWGTSQSEGSDSLIVWESDDLVNWSEERKVKVARDNAGCVWAPESIYDPEKNAYMVFWASPTPNIHWAHRIYRSYTTDFVNFTAPEVYIERDGSVIDTTIIEDKGIYYRFTKDETNGRKYIFMEKSDSLSGDFEEVSTYTLNGGSYKSVTGVEGATIFKMNGVDKWCLYFDDFGGKGYYPFMTDDLSVGKFTEEGGIDFHGTHMRHGSVLPITRAEYDALIAKYDGEEPAETGEVVFSLDFDGGNLDTAVGSAQQNGTLGYVDGVNGGKAVQFSSGNYISVKTDKYGNNPLAGLHTATVSFAVKRSSGNSWCFYAAPDDSAQAGGREKYIGALDSSNREMLCERYYLRGNRPASAAANFSSEVWTHITIVYRRDTTVLYVNGEKKSTVENGIGIRRMLGASPVIYLGKANWGSGEYATCALDAFKIHNYALGDAAVADLYRADMGVTA